jgi:NADPH:quinone reductase-like Zn-dependent oxidoreductase
VLVNGAAGGVGSIAVQLARAAGARVTGVDSGDKLEMVRALGAEEVIDYTREDFTRRGERYDLVLDVASNLSLRGCRRVLTATGIYVLIGHDHFGQATGRVLGSLPRFMRLMAMSLFTRHLPGMSFTLPSKREVMTSLGEALGAGTLTPVIDRIYPLDQASLALRHLQEGRARGRILVAP